MRLSNYLSILGVKKSSQEHEADPVKESTYDTPFRGSVARANYVSGDRIDMHYACKGVCRSMATPTNLSWKSLKRIDRYLCGEHGWSMYIGAKSRMPSMSTSTPTGWVREFLIIWRGENAQETRHQALVVDTA